MRRERPRERFADASTAAVTEPVRSLNENQEASNDLWEEAIEATLTFAEEARFADAHNQGKHGLLHRRVGD